MVPWSDIFSTPDLTCSSEMECLKIQLRIAWSEEQISLDSAVKGKATVVEYQSEQQTL